MTSSPFKIPYGRQNISSEDIEAVVEVLKSDWLTQGPNIGTFEKAVAKRCRADYAIAVNSATAALHIACLALNVGPGDQVWTSPNTFVASANCARYCGAEIDFVDIDDDTLNMSIAALENKLAESASSGKLPKVVIPVHFAGQSCDMAAIKQLSLKYGFHIVEDASHAVGAEYKGSPVGSCEYSDITVFSFHPVKIITTGEGGLLLTNSETLQNRLLRLRSHGITRDPDFMQSAPIGDWDYHQVELGFNYRITDIQAVLGLSQLGKLDEFLLERQKIVRRYRRELADLPIKLQGEISDSRSANHLFVIRVLDSFGCTRRELFDLLRSNGIGVNVHYIPVHMQPYYQRLGFQTGDFPLAERYYSEAISLPVFAGLSHSDQDYVIALIKQEHSHRI
ncbi:MAG TPA: UDP-4-amino-4,6-dideoxy-N-acetyl-beta-L-altrosamine transaminase [Oculatellaceae cyanobacterium]